jgi:hypothetical protein
MQVAGCWMLDAGYWILGLKAKALGAGRKVQG